MKKIKPIKALGQNFLKDEFILRRIADSAQIKNDEVVLEIGAGAGSLTKYLCEQAGFVYGVEIDKGLCRIAEDNLSGFKNVKIICGNILKLDLPVKNIKVVGNLPYYITTPIIFQLLSQRQYISDIFIMVQKEVAKRIAAKPCGKDYGILSCSVQFYARPKILFNINKGAFYPRPKVDSALLNIRLLDRPSVSVKDEDRFFKLIKSAFSQRRKTLLNSLCGKNGLVMDKQDIENILHKTGIDPKRRAETLSLEEFAKLANFL